MLFHKDVFMPTNLVAQHKQLRAMALRFTAHAEQQRKDDRYGFIKKLDYLDTKNEKCQIIEMEYDEKAGRVIKVLYRLPIDEKLDLCIAVIPGITRTSVVKTVWYNERTDNHKTLDKSKYFDPRTNK